MDVLDTASPAAEPSSLPVLGANVKPRVQPAHTALPHRLPSSLLLQPPSPDAVDPHPARGWPSRAAAGSTHGGGRPWPPTPQTRGRGACGEVVPVSGAVPSGTAGVCASLEGSGLRAACSARHVPVRAPVFTWENRPLPETCIF